MSKGDVDWCPSVHLGHNKFEQATTAPLRSTIATRKRTVNERQQQDVPHESPTLTLTSVDKEVQTDLHIPSVIVPASSSDTQCHDFFAESCFTDDDHKVHYYTGLPNSAILVAAFEYMVPIACAGTKREYYWKSYLIMLIKLRLNLGLQDLAYRFKVSLSTISRRFHEFLDIAYSQLDFLIHWPE